MPGPVRWLPGALLVLSASASLLSPASVPRLGNLLDGLESAIARSRGIKCPFFRRRAGDALEAAVVVAQFVGARHKSLRKTGAVYLWYLKGWLIGIYSTNILTD